MKYISWIEENGQPRILGIVDKFFASTGMVRHSTHKQFEKIVGRAKAKAALSKYEEKKNTLTEEGNQQGAA